MSPQFKAGAERALERAKVLAMRNMPMIMGAGTGAVVGNVLSPRDEPHKYRTHGAVLGGLVGYTRLSKWRAGLSSRWQVIP